MKQLAVVLFVCAFGVGSVRAQSTDRPAFDVASVKPSAERSSAVTRYDPQGVVLSRFPLAWLIGEAYGVAYSRVSSREAELRAGLVPNALYDVIGRTGRQESKERVRLMLQRLLTDRFKVALHRDSTIKPVDKLEVAKSGHKLTRVGDEGDPLIVSIRNGYEFHSVDLDRLSDFLSRMFGAPRPVVNATMLPGRYDFVLMFQPPDPATVPDKKGEGEAMRSGILEDLGRLGLKLTADKAAVDSIVVDHLEKPAQD